jgi:hypothetical protein
MGVHFLFRSFDHGLTWQNLSTTWNLIGSVTSVCSIDSMLFFAIRGPFAGIYKSDNYGDSIYPVFNIPDPNNGDIFITRGEDSSMICYRRIGDHGLYESYDNGFSRTDIQDNLPVPQWPILLRST